MSHEIRYWDSDCFLGWLKEEPDKVESCRGVVEGAKKGEILIVTSALTLAEVVKLKHKTPIPESDADKVKAFFMNDYIRVRNVDRNIAELARKLVWTHDFLKPKDSIHIATAIRHRIKLFDTFDRDLMDLTGRLGDPLIRIGSPDLPYQDKLFSEHQEKEEYDEE
ncbi:MAG: PIN domain-containing protein [Desulfomonile sp.]